MTESDSLLSGDSWRRLSGVFSYCGYNLIWIPVVGWVPGDDLAVFADEDRREGMGEGLAIAGGNTDIKELGKGREIFLGGRCEVPVEKLFVGVVAGVGAAVAAEHLGSIVARVKADAEEMSSAVEGRIGCEGVVDVGEVTAHPRAKVGELAAGVDEGHQDEFAFELVEMDRAITLIDEVEVGDRVAGGGDVVGDRRLVVGTSLGDDHDVVELDVRVAVPVLVRENLCGDAITGVKLAGDAGVFEFIVHGHRFHETGNAFAIEGDMSGIRCHYFAADSEGLLRCG
jgi:hypothetical protein